MLTVAMDMLAEEADRKAGEREAFLSEKCPPIQLPHSRDELLVCLMNYWYTILFCRESLDPLLQCGQGIPVCHRPSQLGHDAPFSGGI